MVDMQIKQSFSRRYQIWSTREVNIWWKAAKKIILLGSTSKCPDSSKTKTLLKKEGVSNKGSDYFRNCEGIPNLFYFSSPAATGKLISMKKKNL